MLKKIILTIAVAAFFAVYSFAAVSLDLGIWGATPPVEDYRPAILSAVAGAGVGIGFDVAKIGALDMQARFDINGYSWGEPDWRTIFTGMSVKNAYSRSPVFAGVRIYTPKAAVIKGFADAGVEMSRDTLSIELKDGGTEEDKETNYGFALGAGFELEKILSLGFNARLHINDDKREAIDVSSAYISFGLTGGLSF